MTTTTGSVKAMIVAFGLLAVPAGGAAAARLDYTTLTLIHGWERYSPDTAAPAAALDSNNVVHLKGVMHQPRDSSAFPFVLPVKFRPNRLVYIPVTLLNSEPGRIGIPKSGEVFIQAAGPFVDAQGFTSLEGVTYSKN